MSSNVFQFVADDEEVEVVDFPVSGDVEEPELDYGGLTDAAVSAQRMVVSRLSHKHVDGARVVATPDNSGRTTPEKMFNVNRLLQWNDGDPDMVVEELAQGRLRCRLSARTGLGKSTKLAPYIARALDLRVLHVALDAHALQQVGSYMRSEGVHGYKRNWRRAQSASVSCMTYADFVARMGTTRRVEVFRSFDVFIFDEAFVEDDDVFVAKRCFSVYALAETSLILCSATIRTDTDFSTSGSNELGSFKQLNLTIPVTQAINTGKLVGDYLVDKTGVFVPNNQQIYQLQDSYAACGVDVKILDDGATFEDEIAVSEWLKGDSTTPRVVVMHNLYGIAFNFPIAYCIVFPFETRIEIVGDESHEIDVPMVEEMVLQCKSRSGRGIVKGSGGVIMSPDRSEAQTMSRSQVMSAFVKLFSVGIIPLRVPMWEHCFELFPEGMSVALAHTLLKIALPVEVSVRYLGADGRVASRYASALNAFAHGNHYLIPSRQELPDYRPSWPRQRVPFVKRDVQVQVPVIASGELQVILHAIEHMADGIIEVPRWKLPTGFVMYDGYDSDEDIVAHKPPTVPTKLRRIEAKPLPLPPVNEVKQQIPWAYRALPGSEGLRRGGYIDSDRCREALAALEASLASYTVPVPKVGDVVETSEGTVTAVTEPVGDVESPGGSTVCTLPVTICEKMNVGTVLVPTEFIRMVASARQDLQRFVGSKMFDSFSSPWDSILKSLCRDDVLREVVKRGLSTDTFSMVDMLRGRFNIELVSVLARSNLFKKTYLKVFTITPSMDAVMRAVQRGKFSAVAQTDRFLHRVCDLKDLIDQTLLHAESQNVFLPTYITNAQRNLPMRGKGLLGYEGEDLSSMPGEWQRAITDTSLGVVKSNRKDGFGR